MCPTRWRAIHLFNWCLRFNTWHSRRWPSSHKAYSLLGKGDSILTLSNKGYCKRKFQVGKGSEREKKEGCCSLGHRCPSNMALSWVAGWFSSCPVPGVPEYSYLKSLQPVSQSHPSPVCKWLRLKGPGTVLALPCHSPCCASDIVVLWEWGSGLSPLWQPPIFP